MAHADPHPSDAVAAGEVRSWLEDRRDDIVELTARLARAESPSADGAAQAGMRAILTEEFAAVGLTVESLPGRAGCDHLCAQDRSVDADGPSQLLLGHLDTVWPVGTLERMPVAIHDGRLHGPGVFDMKAGLAQMIYALRALRAVGHRPVCRPVVFVSADEEIGSQTSAEHIRRLARRVRRVLVLEPAFGPRGALKTARKGI
ncbi:MAG TPA: M20/M25/M40 family metallo-hydrolase, partial [Miltoncostaeaceae bacterium]|nr:M20/M25/M40 family metallo-hydrolase [Miltoncostaeaceae bacterium]